MRVKKWIKENILKEKNNWYEVYYIYNNEKIIRILENSTSKVEAKKKVSRFIKNNATPGSKYKFLKVEKIK